MFREIRYSLVGFLILFYSFISGKHSNNFMTVYLPEFPPNFQLAVTCCFTSYRKLPYNVMPCSVEQLLNLPLSLVTDGRCQYSVLDLSCRVLITSLHGDIGIRFLTAKNSAGKFILPKDLVLFITSSILFGKLLGKKIIENLSPCQWTETPSRLFFSLFWKTFLCWIKFNLSKASEHTVKLLLKRFCLPWVSQTLHSISDSFHVGVSAKFFGSPSLWLTSPLFPCYFYPTCQG